MNTKKVKSHPVLASVSSEIKCCLAVVCCYQKLTKPQEGELVFKAINLLKELKSICSFICFFCSCSQLATAGLCCAMEKIQASFLVHCFFAFPHPQKYTQHQTKHQPPKREHSNAHSQSVLKFCTPLFIHEKQSKSTTF